MGGVILSIYYFSREIKIPPLKLLDLIAPFGCLAYSIGRLGCYFNGCCSGIRSNILFSVIYPKSSWHPEYLSVHPVQLYDSYLNFLLFLFLLEYKGKKKFEGELFLLFLIGNSIIRFFVEYFRWGVSTYVLLNFITLPQIVSIAIIIVSIIVIIKKVTNNET
jgi:phosphatidylglycerol:prolipoprotein diacylglycerol transferase